RRTHPVISVASAYLVGLLVLLRGYESIGVYAVVLVIALYSVTAYGPRWASYTALVTGIVGCLLLAGSIAAGDPLSGDTWRIFLVVVLLTTPLLGTAWAVGRLRHARLETRRAREERFARLAVEREQELRLAAQAERARIAREMHDIVAHSLTVMVAQADGGRYAGAAEPAAATRALETIGETGRAALADMRRLLGVLRDDSDDEEPESSPSTLTPQPASGDLESLV